MSDIDSRLKHLLLLMGVCSAVAKAFLVECKKRGWQEADALRTEEAFSVIGPLMLSGLPERETVEKLEEPYAELFANALRFCQDPELDGKTYPRGAARLPGFAYQHIFQRLAVLPKDRDFLELVERYFAAPELQQMVAEMKKKA